MRLSPVPVSWADTRPHPVFITGTGRSGTTLLRRFLTAGDELAIGPELPGLGNAMSRMRRRRWRGWSAVLRAFSADLQNSNYDQFVGVDLDRCFEQLRKVPASQRSIGTVVSLIVTHIVQNLPEFHETSDAVTRWGDKTPWNVFALPEFLRALPNARAVLSVRDPRSYVDSVLEHGLATSSDQAEQRWAKSAQATLEALRRAPQRCLLLRYEDLVDDPSSRMAEVCEFLDLGFSEDMLLRTDHIEAAVDIRSIEHLHGVRTAAVVRERGQPRSQVSAVAESLASELGYPM